MKERTGKTKNVSVLPDGGTMNDRPRQNRYIFFFPFAAEPPPFFAALRQLIFELPKKRKVQKFESCTFLYLHICKNFI